MLRKITAQKGEKDQNIECSTPVIWRSGGGGGGV